MQLADHILVVFRHLAERAPPQAQLIPCSAGHGLGGKPDLLQGGGQSLDGLTRAQPLVGGRLLGEVAPPLAAGLRGGLDPAWASRPR